MTLKKTVLFRKNVKGKNSNNNRLLLSKYDNFDGLVSITNLPPGNRYSYIFKKQIFKSSGEICSITSFVMIVPNLCFEAKDKFKEPIIKDDSLVENFSEICEAISILLFDRSNPQYLPFTISTIVLVIPIPQPKSKRSPSHEYLVYKDFIRLYSNFHLGLEP